MLLSLLADRLVLSPSRDELFAFGKTRRSVPWQAGAIEVWCERTAGDGSDDGLGYARESEPACFVLKFQGKAARAERACLDPLDAWPDLPGEVWTVNPPGYGGSSGRASLKKLGPAAQRVFEHLVQVAAGRPIIVAGNSLGNLSVLYLAARYADQGLISGLVLRNPPPLAELITGKYARPSLGLSRFLAQRVPSELDARANAAAATMPAVFLTSGLDRIVPPQFQQLVFEAYAGPRRRVVLPKAGHQVRFSRRERSDYSAALDWLRRRIPALRPVEHFASLAVAE